MTVPTHILCVFCGQFEVHTGRFRGAPFSLYPSLPPLLKQPWVLGIGTEHNCLRNLPRRRIHFTSEQAHKATEVENDRRRKAAKGGEFEIAYITIPDLEARWRAGKRNEKLAFVLLVTEP